MDAITVLFIALGLAMDAFAVAITSGIAIKRLTVNHVLKIAASFGAFQAAMPLVGWLAGLSLADVISGFDHWVAFGLLGFIGCKMVYEAVRLNPGERPADPLNAYALLVLSIATSMDALAVGVSFAFLTVSIAAPVIVIGTVTFLLSFAGVYVGNRFGHFFERKMQVVGGLVLIAIGVKVLLEHLA